VATEKAPTSLGLAEAPAPASPLPPPEALLERILAPVRAEVDRTARRVNELLRADDPAIAPLVAHLARFHGKLLRPALLALAAHAAAAPEPLRPRTDLATVAAVAEMMHLTSLVHDDVLDESATRRWQATVNAAWGNHSAILLGDFIFSRAFVALSAVRDPRLIERFARAARELCEGELTQSTRRCDLTLSEPEYLEIIRRKTGELFAGAAWLGAALAGGSSERILALERYGSALGVAFQITDDCLDLVGEEALAGKSLGTDLAHGCLTLPLLHYLAPLSPADRERAVAELRLDGEWVNRELAHARLTAAGAVAYSRERARQSARAAREALAGLPDSRYRASLLDLTEYVVARRS
jgi:octaprenyl-diphosphate synthase